MEAEDAIEVGDDEITQWQKKRSHGLYDKLLRGLHAIAVINDAYHIYHKAAKCHGNS